MTNRLKSEEEGSPKKVNTEKEKVDVYSRSGIDRRSGMDRRQMQNLNRYIDDETQRRSVKEQRQTDELRNGWVRISEWSSMYVSSEKDVVSRS